MGGDLIGIDQATVCRNICKVTNVIAQQFHNFIKLPTAEAQIKSKISFHNMHGLPNIIGLIDGTHIATESPGGEQSELFRNRKGYYSINCQFVCNEDDKIIDLVAR